MVSRLLSRVVASVPVLVSEIILAHYGESRRVEGSRGSLLARVSPSSRVPWEGSPCEKLGYARRRVSSTTCRITEDNLEPTLLPGFSPVG